LIYLEDKSWTKIPILHMGGRVMAGGKKISSSFLKKQKLSLLFIFSGVKQLMAGCKT